MGIDRPQLARRWGRLWTRARANGDAAATFERLAAVYEAPERHYHNLRHVAECLGAFDKMANLAEQPDVVEAAIWFHDCVYDPRRADNEEQSADLAEEVMRNLEAAGPMVEHVSRLILATKHLGGIVEGDAAIIVDVDLAILGADEERFDEYERGIRAEYAFVPEREFAQGRIRVLEAFAGRERIYSTLWLRGRLEEKARRNLALSLRRLRTENRGEQ